MYKTIDLGIEVNCDLMIASWAQHFIEIGTFEMCWSLFKRMQFYLSPKAMTTL